MGDPTDRPEDVVRTSWDAASWAYRPQRSASDVEDRNVGTYRGWLSPLWKTVPPGAPVLDLGCGAGLPASVILAERFRVTGVDVSPVQIERARSNVPTGTFRLGDMTEVDFPRNSFDAVVCLYALIHVPRPKQPPLLARIRQWLSPRGRFVVVTGHTAYEGYEEDWLGSGARMYWSHADAATYRRWIEDSGFEVESQTFVPEGTGGHELFHAIARP